MKKSLSTKFRLINADVLEHSYLNPVTIKFDVDFNQVYEVKLKIDYRWDFENNHFGVIVGILYLMDFEEKKHTILKSSIISQYEVYDLKEHFKVKSNNDFEMNISLETSLVSIAISTARGILMERTNGTLIRNIILPLVNPKDLILSPKMNGESKSKIPEK